MLFSLYEDFTEKGLVGPLSLKSAPPPKRERFGGVA